MTTTGILQQISSTGHVRTDVLEADGDLPLLAVLESVLGTPVTADEVAASNPAAPFPDQGRSPEHPTQVTSQDPNDATELADDLRRMSTVTWGEWRTRHPVTVLGGTHFLRGHGPTTVSVVAGPDSGYTLRIDPRSTRLSRLPLPDCLLVADPCLSRSPTRLDLGSSQAETHTIRGSSVIVPGDVIDPGKRPLPAQRHAQASVHVAPATVDEPRPARPPQWWAFLIPIGIGIALALLTGMWWFLLFSLSAPLSGYLAHAMEKRRFARDTAQHLIDSAHAVDEAVDRAGRLIAAERSSSSDIAGLCLGFGASLSSITLAPELGDRVDHVDGHAVIADCPVTIDPRCTSVTVIGAREQLISMLLAWLADTRWQWRPSPALRTIPELLGAVSEDDATTDSRSSPSIVVDLSTSGSTVTLRLDAPSTSATVSVVLGTLGHAHTTISTAPDGPVPGRSFTASLMPPGRFLTLLPDRGRGSPPVTDQRHGLHDYYDDSPSAIARWWAGADAAPALIGRGPAGEVGLDLFRDGPHALIAGTTGSGKSMLLQTWLLALALENPPDRVTFVLIDFKGGATFAPLAALPHTDSVLDDFDSAAAFRALVSVRAEITHREQLLADHGCASIDELKDPPPRLVVVIDEFHALMATHPRAADLLEHLTALGRSLGVHLILATQRPLGIVTGQMKANINIRICLRVRDEADSFDVLGVPDAAHLPPGRPGSALLDAGTAPLSFRVAVPFAEAVDDSLGHRPRLRQWTPDHSLENCPSIVRGIATANVVAAAQGARTAPSRRVVLPPLPESDGVAAHASAINAIGLGVGLESGPDFKPDSVSDFELDDGRRQSVGSDADPLPATGIIDIPTAQRQTVWTYDPLVDGSTVLLGDAGPDAASALARMASAAARSHRIVALGRIAEIIQWAEIRCGMEAGWRLHIIVDHLAAHHGQVSAGTVSAGSVPAREFPAGAVPADATADAPTLVVCDNWSELIDSLDHHAAAALERLLTHARGLGLTFLLSGCRSALLGTARFSSRVVFPPSSGADGLSVGLSRQRFLGTWPRLRAVLLGPRVADTGSDGADVQLAPFDPDGDAPCGRTPFTPRWQGLGNDPRDGDGLGMGRDGRIPVGIDPFGEPVMWDPVRDGPVLTVRGSSGGGKSEAARMLLSMTPSITVHDDAHLLAEVAPDLLDGGVHVVTMPLRFTPGYGSPLTKAQSSGPLLVLGTHSRQDLTTLGILRLPPLDGDPGTGWFVTESGARAVRLFRAEAPTASPAPTSHSVAGPSPAVPQTESAGGPVRVSYR